jgi:hypothetical protein
MPRYYFHSVDDDATGHELPDEAAARAMGRETFLAMIREGTIENSGHMEVMDEKNRRVAMFSFRSE